MENTKKYNLTEGGILNKLLVISLPIMAMQFVQMTYNLTDMFWLGKVSSDAVAASGTAGMYLWLSMGFLMFGRMGAEIGVSQNMGKGDTAAAMGFSQNSLFISLVSGIVFGGVLIIFNRPLIGFFNIQEAAVASSASIYLVIVGAGIPATYISAAVSGSFGGSGNSRTPFYINAIGLLVNMILDPILILTLDMGIQGAAIATVTAQILVCALSLLALKRSRARPFPDFKVFIKPHLETIKRIFKWSVPICVESMLFCFLSMIISRFVAAWGADAIAAQKVGSQIESLSWLIGGGFASAVTAFIGQNYGAGKWARIHRGFRVSAVIMVIWGVVITAVIFLGARVFSSAFLTDPDIIDISVKYLRILSTCQLIYCLEVIAAGAFRGIGKTMPPSLATTTGNALRIPIVYFLSKTSLGLDGIWWGIAIGSILRSLLLFLWYVLHAKGQPREDIAASGLSPEENPALEQPGVEP